MALATKDKNYTDARLGCYFVDAHATVTAYLDDVQWGRDSGNASHSRLWTRMNANLYYDTLVWGGGGGNFTNNNIWVWTNLGTQSPGNRDFPKGGGYCNDGRGCCYCLCGGTNWMWSNHYGYFDSYLYGDINTTQIGFSAQYLGEHTGDGYWNLPDNLRVLPPVGLSVSWPSSITGSASASISSWANNPNIGGTPTSYPGASYWNWAINLLDENGNMVAHKTFNTGETRSCSFGAANTGWYTASALNGSAGALGSPYTIFAGKKYKLRVYAQNNMNQRLTADSGWYISSPPKPNVSISSIVYNPTTKKNRLCFVWSLGASSLTPETVTYKVTLPDGTSVASGTLKSNHNGAAISNTTQCVDGIPTGDLIKVTVTNTAGTAPNQMSESASATEYAPVANAAFLGFDWDELRRACTIRAEAPGAANCRIEAGYQANNYNIGNKLTTGEVGTLVVKDLNHGSGQILYLQATPESSNGHQYLNEIAKISIPIPNPILGVHTPSCEKIEVGAEKEYIVDIIEKKKGASTCTQRWQNGDRVVVKNKCLPVIPPEGGVSSGPVSPANSTIDLGSTSYVAEVGEQTPAVVCNNNPTVAMRLQRPCHMTVEIDWPALFPDIDFSLSTTKVSSGSSGGGSPSVDGQYPLYNGTYNKTTHKSVIELGSPEPFSGVWKCWNTKSKVDFSTANEKFYVEISLGGLSWHTVYNPQQFVFAIIVSRGGTQTYFGGVKEETLHLTDSTS